MLMGHGVRHGVDLELEADLDDIEGGDAKSKRIAMLAVLLLSCLGSWRYREISPAIPPARTTCRRVPWKMSVRILRI